MTSKDNTKKKARFKSSSNADLTLKTTLKKPGGELVHISSFLKV